VTVLETALQAIADDTGPAAARRFADLASRFLGSSVEGQVPVTSAAGPDALYQLVDEPVPETGLALDQILDQVERSVLDHSIRLSHPMYLGHQVSAPLPSAVWTEILISALNNSVAVREMSPAGTALETRLIRWMCELAGLPAGAGGTLTSGGTEATFTALLAARAASRPEAWQQGIGEHPPVIVCGEHAHYAVTRAAGELGLGMNRVRLVPSRDFHMDTDALVQLLDRLQQERQDVMAVVATAGSTATGSFDDLERIGSVCGERGLWLHVDGAHGASAVFSESRRVMLRGLRHARSIAWDPHKMMLMPLSAGMLLVRDESDLARAFSQRAPYLFHEGDGERGWDQGPRSFACSRRFDALKVWVGLKRHGTRGIGALYDHLCDLAVALAERLSQSDSFVVLHRPECNILCFRWIGGGGSDDELDQRNRELRERYNASGQGWITTTVLDGRQALRVTIMNPRTTTAHLDRLVEGLQRTGEALRLSAAEVQR
jgi:L-2,4-diaminobutyrate decarboxylase